MVSSSRTIRDTREWLAKTCESPALGNDHFFDNRGYVIMCDYCGKVLRVTHIHLQYILVVVSYLCLLAALGGQFVDDDMLQSPLLSTMQRYDVSGLLISSVAIPVPLLLDLAGDVYHLMSRNLETFTDDADATLYRMVIVCKKEFVLRLAFLVALGVPSAVLVFKDPFVSEASHSLVPYMTSFCRCITLYCATTGYMSDLFDVTWTAKTLSLLSSVAFTLGLLLVFYARVDRSEGYFAWDDVGGLAGIVLAVSATIIFVARVVRYAAVVAWREATSLQSTIRMEEYVFVCYGTGAVFVVTTILLCDFSRVDGRLLYDFLHAPAVVVYYVLMIVGTLAAVLLCTRALRSWSFDVRYASLTARVLQLDGMLTSKLLAVATANAAPKQVCPDLSGPQLATYLTHAYVALDTIPHVASGGLR